MTFEPDTDEAVAEFLDNAWSDTESQIRQSEMRADARREGLRERRKRAMVRGWFKR